MIVISFRAKCLHMIALARNLPPGTAPQAAVEGSRGIVLPFVRLLGDHPGMGAGVRVCGEGQGPCFQEVLPAV